SAAGALQAGNASLSQGAAPRSNHARLTPESRPRPVQGGRAETGDPDIHSAAEECTCSFARGAAPDHLDRVGPLWRWGLRRGGALSKVCHGQRTAESAVSFAPGAQLPFVQTVPMCFGFIS